MTYLSLAPEGLREAFITGGLPPLGRRASTTSTARTYARHARAQPALLRALPRRPRARARRCAAPRRRGRPAALAATGSRARRLRQLGGVLGMSDGAEALHYLLELARRLARVPPRRRGGARLRAQPALRRPARGVLGRRRRDALGGASACCPTPTTSSPSCSPASTSSRGCSRSTARSPRCARPRRSSPRASGRALYDPDRLAANEVPVGRARSTPRTCTSSARSPRRPPAAIRGLRPVDHQRVRAQRPARRRRARSSAG